MKKLSIDLYKNNTAVSTTSVKSECAMWRFLRQVRDGLTQEEVTAGVRAVVTQEDGTPFKDITFRTNSKGKIEMPNAVKETNRKQIKKSITPSIEDEIGCNTPIPEDLPETADEFDPEKLEKIG